MRTEELIKSLAEDAAPPPPLWRRTGFAAAAGASAAAVLFWASIGIRPDFGAALETWRFTLKLSIAAVAVAALAWEFQRHLRPQAQTRLWPAGIVIGLLTVAVLVEFTALPRDVWGKAAIGTNWRACLTTIPFLSALPLAAAIWAMRQGAPASPVAAGAIAGSVSAAFGALLYGAHCTDDSPLFVAIWYPLAAAVVVGAGALAGRFALRW